MLGAWQTEELHLERIWHTQEFFCIVDLAICVTDKHEIWLHYYAKLLDFIQRVQKVVTNLVRSWQASSVVEGYHFTFGSIEVHLICARPFIQVVNIGVKE